MLLFSGIEMKQTPHGTKLKAMKTEDNKVVKVEIIETTPNYKGEGNYNGNVLIEVTYGDGTTSQLDYCGEHSEYDMLVNYTSPNYFND